MATQDEYHEGDLIRVTNKETGEGFQSRARTCPDGGSPYAQDGTLFLASEWKPRWQEWTFLDYWTREDAGYGDSGYTVEIVERACLYTKAEVMNKVRATAWAIDPDYLHGGQLNVLRQKLEESL